jgi:O-antigen ligase
MGAMWWLLYYSDFFMNAIGRDFSMTGRVDLWKAIFSVIKERPLLGYGYEAFWTEFGVKDAYISRFAGWLPGSAHNGFLDIMLELGVAGAIIFGIHYVLSLRRAMNRINAERMMDGATIWPLAYITCLTLTNLVESPILRQYSLYWVLYVSIATSLSFSNDSVILSTAS